MIRIEPLGDLRLILLDRPEKRNALHLELIERLRAEVEAAAGEPSVRGLVLAGTGLSFSAGVDLREFAGGTPESGRRLITALRDLCAAVRTSSLPVACALHGHCLGGALELAAAADLRVADPETRLGMPEPLLGLPSVIDAALLERHVGISRAHELMLTGDSISGREAHEWGLVNRLAPATEVVDAAAVLLGRVTRHPAETIAAQKRLFARWLEVPMSMAIDAGIEPLVAAFAAGLPQAAARRAARPVNLPTEGSAPYELLGSEELVREGNLSLRRDQVDWPGGESGRYTVLQVPGASFVVPLFEDGTTVLVRQWRHAWGENSWEVPAGTMEAGETPEDCARRELAEEAGLAAARWTHLGSVHGSALMTNSQHLYLAEELEVVDRSPEGYERDMILQRLPLAEAVAAARDGRVVHAAAVSALCRAASRLGRL